MLRFPFSEALPDAARERRVQSKKEDDEMTPGTGGGSQCRRAELRPAEPQMLRVFARPRRLRPRRAIRDFRACARMAVSCYPLPRFSRRRKEGPTPVLRSERRRGRSRGGYSSLPREAAFGELSGRAVVEAVVRVLAHRDEVPTAEAPAGEVLCRVDVVHDRRRLSPAVSQRLLAQRLLAEHAGSQSFPSFACVIHGQIKKRRASRYGRLGADAVRLSPRM